jgi:hypothetical protein
MAEGEGRFNRGEQTMGLDSVALVMEFEEAFGIQITDEEATNIRTPRMVIDLVLSKLRKADEHVCRSQRAFYIIRKVLVRNFGLPRRSVTPDMRLRDLIPESRRKELWEQFQAALAPSDWPGLVLPWWISRSILLLCVVAFAAGGLIEIRLSGRVGAGLGVGAGLAMALGIVALLLTRPYCTCIPSDILSVRDLIPYGIMSAHMSGWTREEVAVVVKRLTMDQLGLRESDYSEDSRFVEDFNIS